MKFKNYHTGNADINFITLKLESKKCKNVLICTFCDFHKRISEQKINSTVRVNAHIN